MKGDGAHVFRGLLALSCLAGASERELFCAVRMSASGLVANASEMHSPLLAPSPELVAETSVVDVNEPCRAHGVLLSWKMGQTQGMEHIQDLELNDVFISDIVDTCALDTHLPIEFDESANWIEAMCTGVGFDVWPTFMELRPQRHDFNDMVLQPLSGAIGRGPTCGQGCLPPNSSFRAIGGREVWCLMCTRCGPEVATACGAA